MGRGHAVGGVWSANCSESISCLNAGRALQGAASSGAVVTAAASRQGHQELHLDVVSKLKGTQEPGVGLDAPGGLHHGGGPGHDAPQLAGGRLVGAGVSGRPG